jgi:hypothetical protein
MDYSSSDSDQSTGHRGWVVVVRVHGDWEAGRGKESPFKPPPPPPRATAAASRSFTVGWSPGGENLVALVFPVGEEGDETGGCAAAWYDAWGTRSAVPTVRRRGSGRWMGSVGGIGRW